MESRSVRLGRHCDIDHRIMLIETNQSRIVGLGAIIGL